MRAVANFTTLAWMLLFVCSCKKRPFDYRNEITGDYNFQVWTNYYNPDDGSVSNYGECAGEIYYFKKGTELIAEFDGCRSTFSFSLDKETDDITSAYGYDGTFENDTVVFRNYFDNSPASGGSVIIVGVKTK
jgi:hypothetical protein